jgi:hypothetical protein
LSNPAGSIRYARHRATIQGFGWAVCGKIARCLVVLVQEHLPTRSNLREFSGSNEKLVEISPRRVWRVILASA